MLQKKKKSSSLKQISKINTVEKNNSFSCLFFLFLFQLDVVKCTRIKFLISPMTNSRPSALSKSLTSLPPYPPPLLFLLDPFFAVTSLLLPDRAKQKKKARASQCPVYTLLITHAPHPPTRQAQAATNHLVESR